MNDTSKDNRENIIRTSKSPRIIFTGGHLTPAIAVLDELKKRGCTNIVWVGRKRTMSLDRSESTEYVLISKDKKIPFENIVTGKIIKISDIASLFEFIVNILRLPIGFLQALIIILKHKPSVIVSFGGYIAIPIVITAWLFRIPSVTHEQTVVTGKANKLISKFSKKILVSWNQTKKYFDSSKVVVTGNPIRKEVLSSETSVFNINKRCRTIYITGGNQGSHTINKVIIEVIGDLIKKYNVIHQTGISTKTGDYERCDRMAKSLIGKGKGVYIVRGRIFGKEIGEVFDKADILVSRSGANIVTEILALSKMSILIPIPWSINNEQLENAKILEEIGIGRIIEQKKYNADILLDTISEAFDKIGKRKDFNGKVFNKTKKVSKSLVDLNAASKIADQIIDLIE